jgi:hypothetical protein
MADLMVRSGVECFFVHRHLVPDLMLDEEVLGELERRLKIKINRVDCPRRLDMFESDTLCINKVWGSKVSAGAPRPAAYDKVLKERFKTEWMCMGIRKADGPTRRLALTKYPNPNPKLHRCYPLANWSTADVWQYTKERGLPISKAYALIGRSLDCLNIVHTYPLKHGMREDYNKIINDFPLVDALCWLYEKRAAKYGMNNLPEC